MGYSLFFDRPPIQKAVLYRMVMDDHLCPFGLKAKALLERKGYFVDDRWLETRAETEAFQAKHHVDTTPQVFIGGHRIGGYDALRAHLDLGPLEEEGTTYTPVLVTFGVALVLALALNYLTLASLVSVTTLSRFVAIAMVLLALQKLQDLVAFQNRFITYDLLGMRAPRYAFVYPFLELLAGGLMLTGLFPVLSAPVATFIGGLGAVSVFKAVYVDKRALKCGCVGGDKNVPLGALSLTENVMMFAMGVATFAWMAG